MVLIVLCAEKRLLLVLTEIRIVNVIIFKCIDMGEYMKGRFMMQTSTLSIRITLR